MRTGRGRRKENGDDDSDDMRARLDLRELQSAPFGGMAYLSSQCREPCRPLLAHWLVMSHP